MDPVRYLRLDLVLVLALNLTLTLAFPADRVASTVDLCASPLLGILDPDASLCPGYCGTI